MGKRLTSRPYSRPLRKDLTSSDDDIDTLISQVGDAKEQPQLPPGGIKRQWLPCWIRWPVRLLLLPFVWLDILTQRAAKLIIRPPFKQKGHCLRRGNCCHYILIRASRGPFKWIDYLWNTQFNGFYYRVKTPHIYDGKAMWVMGCRYLKKNGSCGCYYLRPLVCREWPVIERFDYPQIIKGCGYFSDPPYIEKGNID